MTIPHRSTAINGTASAVSLRSGSADTMACRVISRRYRLSLHHARLVVEHAGLGGHHDD